MQLIRNLHSFQDPAPTAVAIGNFDGLHRGHRAVIETMLQDAAAKHLVPSVLTFEPHPRRHFTPSMPSFRLETLSQKLHRLAEWGVARVYMPRFNAAFAAQSAEEFLETVLRQQLRAQVVVTGENFAFGKARSGTAAVLRDWGTAHHVTVHSIAARMVAGIACSSSAVREALGRADVAGAAELLGRPYRLAGRVLHGDRRGHGLGFPTANIALPAGLKLPAHGVYAVRAQMGGEVWSGVANLGVRPSVGIQTKPSLEVHLFNFEGDLYGRRLMVDFIAYVRPEVKFDSLDALKKQIAEDCVSARKTLQRHSDLAPPRSDV